MNYIYDLDDTLIKNSDVPHYAAYMTFRELLKSQRNKDSQEQPGSILKQLKHRYSSNHLKKTREYTEKGLIKLAPGVKNFLKGEDGFQAGLTNAPHPSTDYKIEELGLDQLLDEVVTPRNVRRKPSTEGIEKIITESGLGRKEFIYVGDSIEDLVAGKRAGLRTVLITDSITKKVFASETYNSFREFAEKH
ncbi:MAG: HAD family hydrolase [Candidatus Nanohalobium sp.]